MSDAPKSSNATVLIIAFAVVLIVAMVCGMVMWIMQRTMAMNEKLIDARLAEAQLQARSTQVVVSPQPQVLPPHPDPRPQVEDVVPEQKTPPTIVQPKKTVTKKSKMVATKKSEPKKSESKTPTEPKKVETVKETVKAPETTPAQESTTTEAKPTTQSKTTTSLPEQPIKREPPKETKEALKRVGPDGLPRDRINLSVGNDDLDWQL